MGSTTDVLAAISAEPLDHSSATPLYRQLKHRFLQLIATGTLDENTPLPTEHALCAAFGLSRSTVRHCLKDLADEGYVNRHRGQGTYVSEPESRGGLDRLYMRASTSSNFERKGAAASSRYLGLRRVAANGATARSLEVEEGEPLWEINRLRFADGKVIVHELAFVPVSALPELSAGDLEGTSIYVRIAESSMALPERTEEKIEGITLDKHEAKLLEARPGAPGLRIIARSIDTQGHPFEASVGIARADRYHLEVTYTTRGIDFAKTI